MRTTVEIFVWEKVFFNLEDFGCWFADGKRAVPNPYGPIQMRICPETIYHAEDVAVSLTSAGGQDFDRSDDSLSLEEILRLYPRPREKRVVDRDAYELLLTQRDDGLYRRPAGNPEMSCNVPDGLMPLKYVHGFVVDPICVSGAKIVDLVRDWSIRYGISAQIVERTCAAERKGLYQELVDILSKKGLWGLGDRPSHTLAEGASEELVQWASGIRERGLDWQLGRYCNYMLSGTIEKISAGQSH